MVLFSEFLCDRLKDHYTIIPHALFGILSLVRSVFLYSWHTYYKSYHCSLHFCHYFAVLFQDNLCEMLLGITPCNVFCTHAKFAVGFPWEGMRSGIRSIITVQNHNWLTSKNNKTFFFKPMILFNLVIYNLVIKFMSITIDYRPPAKLSQKQTAWKSSRLYSKKFMFR